MKKTLTILSILAACSVHAQNLQEWTRQKKTQIKYLIEQIAAFQIYSGYVEKGYSIAEEGLHAIHTIKNGDFSLHNEYFNSLKIVNQKIKNYWKVSDIIALQFKIVRACHSQRNAILQSGLFSPDETSYCSKVLANLLDGCTDIIDQLMLLTTDGSSQMKDDERISRIDGLHADMMDRFVFTQHFAREAHGLALQRLLDANDLRTSRALLNIGE